MAIKKKVTNDLRRRHKFISFRERVDGMKIDPVRRAKRNNDIGDKPTESFFHVALQTWKELNNSPRFVNFAQNVTPISQSLPQVLYHKAQIFNMLNDAIAEKEKFVSQALLDLLAQFAHDIGPEFEEFLPKAVGTLISVSLHEDIEVVEWTFNCMAYLFKYLFRYLVDKLSETFDLISPLFAQRERRPHLSRFAAESFSFFLRNSKQTSIDFFLDHAFRELAVSKSANFETAICVICTEAMKGPDATLNSKAPRLTLQLQQYCASGADERKFHVFLTILTDTLHHVNKSTSGPLYKVIFKWIEKQLSRDDVSPELTRQMAQELLLLLGLRKGTRVPDWEAALDTYRMLLVTVNRFPKSEIKSKAAWELCKVSQCFLRHADNMDETLATKIVENVYNIDDSQSFLPFFDSFTDLLQNSDYYGVIWLYLQRFIDQLDKIDSYSILIILTILKKWNLPADTPQYVPIRGSKVLASFLVKEIQDHTSYIKSGYKSSCSSLGPQLELLYNVFEVSEDVIDCVISLVNILSAREVSESNTSVIYGRALSLVAKNLKSTDDKSRLMTLLKESSEQFEKFRSNRHFVHGLIEMLEICKRFGNPPGECQGLVDILKDLIRKVEINLRDENSDLRRESLKLLSLICQLKDESVPEVVNICLTIEQTAFEIATARTLSMHIRRIAIEFRSLKDEQLRLNIISYCFALIKSQFQPVWQEASSTFVKLASGNEDAIWNRLFEGIASPPESTTDDLEIEYPTVGKSYDAYVFHCTNVQDIETKSTHALQKQTHSDILLREYYANDTFTGKVDEDTVRRRCFGVLNNLSRIAEQRSSELVPIFLACVDGVIQKKSVLLDILSLLSCFKNPSISLNSDGIYDHLMRLLASPDSDIQKRALDCIFTWGDASINIYKDHLQNLLRQQVYKDELNKLLLSNVDGSVVTPEHAPSVMPLIVHILYGAAIGYHGNSNGKAKSSHRSTIISSVGNLPSEYVSLFIHLASEGIPSQVLLDFGSASIRSNGLTIAQSQLRRITGFMNMAEDILRVLKGHVDVSGDYLLQAILSCTVFAQRGLDDQEASTEILTMVRSIRSIGMKCLEIILKDVPTINWDRYKDVLFREIILPRIQHFKNENTQDVSPIMRIFLIWSSTERLLPLLDYDDTIIPQIMETMDLKAAKDPIFLAVIQFMANLFSLQQSSVDRKTNIAITAMSRRALSLFLPRFVHVLSSKKAPEIVESGVAVLRLVVNNFGDFMLSNSLLLEHYVDVCLSGVTSWGRNAHNINDVFEVLGTLVPAVTNGILLRKCYDELSPLLQVVKERHTRVSLVKIFSSIGINNDNVKMVADLLVELNSYSKVKLDEVDYERRLSAYAKFNIDLWSSCSPLQWGPILHDSIFWIATSDEIAIKSGASSVLKRFIEVTATKAELEDTDRVQFFSLMESVIIPAIRSGLRSETDILRYEHVAIVNTLVRSNAAYPKVTNLQVLLFDGDEEANFFNNIVHIQSHRRQRAIYRLGQIALTHPLGDFNIAHVLLPLLEHFLRDVSESTSGMAEEAISTIGKLSMGLSWNQYQAVVKRYLSNLEKNREKVRFFARLLDSVAEAIYHRSVSTEVESRFKAYNASKVDAYLAKEVAPKLRNILKISDENTVADRAMVTVPLIKFLCGTSEETLVNMLSNVILELSQHLKNRLQDVRDTVRKVLAKVAVIVGPRRLSLIVQQMQTVLKRGSQKHVLSFTVHSLLVALISTPGSKHGDLDPSLEVIMDICMDDIFGVTGAEKDADDYISKAREVKENKSYDSIEILSSNVSVGRFNDLLSPVRRVLGGEHISLKIERKIDDLLRRICTGISQNEEGCSHEVISFCLARCSENPEDWRPVMSGRSDKGNSRQKRFLVTQRGQVQKNLADNMHYLQRFGLDVIKNCLRKNRDLIGAFELQEFVQSLRPYLASQHEDIQLSSLKLLSTAAKYSPLLEKLDTEFLFTYVVAVVHNSRSTTTELCQTGLKLLATLLQKKKYSTPDESSIAHILQKIQLDFIEPDKQSHSFAFVKAILLQKIVIPEVYDVMDKIREIMVNSGSNNTREVCKSLFCQFLMDYPQGRGRLNKHMRFLVHNLNYEYATGRESVMEVLYVLLSKLKNDSVQSIIELFFVPLTMILVNDESMSCKEMALLLFRTIIEKANVENSQSMKKSCSEWMSQKDSPELKEVASQIFGILNELGKGVI
ncbi:hypothetical protein POJ06DRAFT_301730 [Lipomyces tetrasporus]|uniref:Uncharacterized protein n=1 Tax=Lipomyces tetrasporus TaxID=54092 RepID=A0AAD7VS21_9ASCO|nr:uncharacterized protein POJ06DRAFT_301730 [Lipomyces tetrasporus]KAJ8099878.1 hypothetical protein POJ06DRAFT_301730 [Lipomyces tetrasporus]